MVTEAGRYAGARTLAVGYRLAPEHPFPAAFEDAMRAWRFLRDDGVPAGRIAIGGDSAGAGLTLALTNELKRAGAELPGCLWLVSPWTDLTLSGATLATKSAVDPLIHKEYLEELATAMFPPAWTAGTREFRPLRRSQRPAADADPGRLGRDPAQRRGAFRRSGRRGRRRRHARDLAAYDPCLADVERASQAGPAGADAGGGVHAAVALSRRGGPSRPAAISAFSPCYSRSKGRRRRTRVDGGRQARVERGSRAAQLRGASPCPSSSPSAIPTPGATTPRPAPGFRARSAGRA